VANARRPRKVACNRSGNNAVPICIMRCSLFSLTTLTLATSLLAPNALADQADEFEYKRRASKVGARNVRAHFVLALWCADKKMAGRAWKHHANVLSVQTTHRASTRAQKALRPDLHALAREAMFAPNGNIRSGAITALRRTKDPIRHVLPALGSKSLRTRMRAVRALGALGQEAAVAPLVQRLSIAGGSTTGAYISTGSQHSYVQDFDVEVA
jgi:hypothetical protein